MTRAEMDELVERHLAAERAGDAPASVAMYSDDVEHDVVGFPTGPVRGKHAAQGFYEHLVENLETEAMVPTRRYYGEDFCVMEHAFTATVTGELLGLPGNGRRIETRMLHVWEFRDGLISRENVWIDGGGIVAQLSTAVR